MSITAIPTRNSGESAVWNDDKEITGDLLVDGVVSIGGPPSVPTPGLNAPFTVHGNGFGINIIDDFAMVQFKDSDHTTIGYIQTYSADVGGPLTILSSIAGLDFYSTGAYFNSTVKTAGGVSVGTNTAPPASGLRVAGETIITAAPPASANRGLLSLGNGSFDGATSGYFAGDANGTIIAANVPAASNAELINIQRDGKRIYGVDWWGSVIMGGSLIFKDTSQPGTLPTYGYFQFGGGAAPNHNLNLVTNNTPFNIYASNVTVIGSAISGGSVALDVTPAAHTNVTTEVRNFRVRSNTITITGSITDQRFVSFGNPTITSTTPQTVTNAATVQIFGAPIAAGSTTITNARALWVQNGISQFDGQVLGPSSGIVFGFVGDISTGITHPGAGMVGIADTGVNIARFWSGVGLELKGIFAFTSAIGTGADVSLRRLAAGAIGRTEAIPANANYGAISIGSGAFDGATPGFFTGNANGTGIAINTASGYTGDLVHFQVGGASKLKITNTGDIVSGNSLTVNGSGNAMFASNSMHFFIVPVGGNTENVLTFNNLGYTKTITGAMTTQRFALFGQNIISAASAQTVITAATAAIAGPPTAAGSATITNPRAFWVQSGITQLDGSLYINDGTWDASNYRRLNAGWSGGDFIITVNTAGTGATGLGHFQIIAPSGKSLRFGAAGSLRWQISPSGHLFSEGDNSYDIGSSTDLRPKDVYIAGRIFKNTAIPANANYGAINVGSGAWDGVTPGFFTGSASGTGIAINATSGYAGDLFNFQVGGASKAKLNNAGDLALAGGALNLNGSGNEVRGSGGSLVLTVIPGTNTTESSINLNTLGFSKTITGAMTMQRFAIFGQNTITAASAQTVTNAATIAITGAPIAAGSATITNAYALWSQGGYNRFDGRLIYTAPATAPADADLQNGQISAWLDESGNNIKFKAKKSDGTVLTATVALA